MMCSVVHVDWIDAGVTPKGLCPIDSIERHHVSGRHGDKSAEKHIVGASRNWIHVSHNVFLHVYLKIRFHVRNWNLSPAPKVQFLMLL